MMLSVLVQTHHAAAPPGPLSFLIVAIAVVVVAWVFYLAIRMTVSPGETEPDHIKRTILEDKPER